MALPLSSAVRDELLLACILAPFASTDVRAEYPELAYALDASPFAGGFVESPLPESIAREAWRLRTLRGHARALEGAWHSYQ